MPLPLALGGALVGGAIGTALVTRVLLGIGFGVVTYVGVGAMLTTLEAQVWSNLGGTSASVLTVLGMARVDDALKVVFSAMSAKLVLRGLTALGTLKVARWKWVD